MDVAVTTTIVTTRPGKAAQAVGHMAKAAVAEAKSLGVDLPKNAQGMAASAIARGAEASSVFAAIVVSEPLAGSNETDFGPSNLADSGALSGTIDGAEANSETIASYSAASEVVGDGALNEAETALALLENLV